MRTEDDLRAALTTLEREAPDARDVLARVDSPVRRRATRPRILIATAAATALAVAAVPTLRALRQASDEPAAPTPPWTYAFTMSAPQGWRIASQNVGLQTQSATLVGKGQCEITSFQPGVFDPSRLYDRKPVTVNGHRGYIADAYSFQGVFGKKDADPKPARLGDMSFVLKPRPVVAWEYDRGAWRMSDCATFASDVERNRAHLTELELTMANAVSDTPRPLRAPVRIGYLPAGWSTQLVTNDGAAGGSQPDFWLEAPAPGTERDGVLPAMERRDAKPPKPPTSSPTSRRDISILYSKGAAPALEKRGSRTTVNGLPAWVWHDPKPRPFASKSGVWAAGILIEGDGFHLRIESMSDQRDFTGELRKIAEQLTIASDPLDESTWFDGTVAIP